MKRKLLYILFIFLIPIFFIGCTVKLGSYTINNFSVTKKKPNNYFYTNNLIKNLAVENSIKVKLFDTNFSKEKELTNEDIDIIKKFAVSLKKSNFIDKPKELPEKPAYKLFFTFNNEKFVINIYNEKYLSVHPWDGTYSVDYINMDGVQSLYNLFGLCKYLIPR